LKIPLIFFLMIAGYLLGSIPAAYVVGRIVKKIDLRQYGSGTVSSSMVWEHVGHWAVIPVALFDVFKASVPVWLAIQFNLGEIVALMIGICVVAGHNWPIFLKFQGGRGLSPMIGILLVLFPPGVVWLICFLLLGRLYEPPIMALLGLITLPILVILMKGSKVIYFAAGLFLLITLMKRLEANQRALPSTIKQKWSVLLLRLLYDRDIKDHQAWIHRKPENQANSASSNPGDS